MDIAVFSIICRACTIYAQLRVGLSVLFRSGRGLRKDCQIKLFRVLIWRFRHNGRLSIGHVEFAFCWSLHPMVFQCYGEVGWKERTWSTGFAFCLNII